LVQRACREVLICVKDGAPPHKDGKKVSDEFTVGIKEVMSVLRDHNAVFIGDDGLKEALDNLLTKHRVKKLNKDTPKQKEYVKVVEDGLKKNPSIAGV